MTGPPRRGLRGSRTTGSRRTPSASTGCRPGSAGRSRMAEVTSKSVELYVAPARLERWMANFLKRHGATASNVVDGALVGFAQDGSSFEARLPFGRTYSGPA